MKNFACDSGFCLCCCIILLYGRSIHVHDMFAIDVRHGMLRNALTGCPDILSIDGIASTASSTSNTAMELGQAARPALSKSER